MKVKSSVGDLRMLFADLQAQGGGTMSSSDGPSAPAEVPEKIPFMQRVLDNPFLLLFLGVTIPTVFYVLWGVMEVASIPIAK
jgi:hypothetical protein